MPLLPARVIAPNQAGFADALAGADRLHHPGTHIWRGLVIALTGLIGTCASFALFVAINGWQAHVEDIRFSSLARDHLRSINAGLEDAVTAFLAHPGPALLDVKVNRMELVMPPKVEPAQVLGTALYSVKAVLDGRPGDVLELVTSNFLK